MNWKNPVRVTAYIGWEVFNGVAFLVGEWVRYGVRAGQIFLAIPPTAILFCGGGGVRRLELCPASFSGLLPCSGNTAGSIPPDRQKGVAKTNPYCNTISQPLTS